MPDGKFLELRFRLQKFTNIWKCTWSQVEPVSTRPKAFYISLVNSSVQNRLTFGPFTSFFFCESKNVQIIHLRNKRKKKSRFWCYQLKHFRKTKGKGEHVNLSAGDRTIETLCSADCTHGHSPKYIYSIILYTRVASVCRHSSVRASASSDGFSNSK